MLLEMICPASIQSRLSWNFQAAVIVLPTSIEDETTAYQKYHINGKKIGRQTKTTKSSKFGGISEKLVASVV